MTNNKYYDKIQNIINKKQLLKKMNKKDIHVKLPKELHTKLKVKCAYKGASMQDYATKLLFEDIENQPIRKCSVLVFNDAKSIGNPLYDFFQDSYQVTTVDNYIEAVELIKRLEFDILVIDVRAIEKSSIRILQKVIESKPEIKSGVMIVHYSN